MNRKFINDDTELLSLLHEGDVHAFELIYKKYASELYRYARRNIDIKEDCEEIIQDVFESLWTRRQDLEVNSLRHYLFTSIRYKIIRYFQHRKVKVRYADHYRLFAALYDTLDSQETEAEIIQERMLKSISTLPERCQMAIKLRILENRTNAEIAQIMNITKKTVELYISKAFGHLRSCSDSIYPTS